MVELSGQQASCSINQNLFHDVLLWKYTRYIIFQNIVLEHCVWVCVYLYILLLIACMLIVRCYCHVVWEAIKLN